MRLGILTVAGILCGVAIHYGRWGWVAVFVVASAAWGAVEQYRKEDS